MNIGTYKPVQLAYLRERNPGRIADVDRLIGTPDDRGLVRIDTHGDLWRELHGQPPLPKRPWEMPGYGSDASPATASVTSPRPPDPDDDYGPAHQPGAMMHVIFEKIGYHAAPNCGCAAFAQQMNRWGWLACLTTRKELIVRFFIEQARSQGIDVKSDDLWGLFVGGGKDRLSAIQSKVAGGVLKLLGMTPKPDKVE